MAGCRVAIRVGVPAGPAGAGRAQIAGGGVRSEGGLEALVRAEPAPRHGVTAAGKAPSGGTRGKSTQPTSRRHSRGRAPDRNRRDPSAAASMPLAVASRAPADAARGGWALTESAGDPSVAASSRRDQLINAAKTPTYPVRASCESAGNVASASSTRRSCASAGAEGRTQSHARFSGGR